VTWLALSPLNSADRLPAALAAGCGIELSHGGDPLDEVIDFLREREVLLVLDNFDHLTSGAGLLALILDAAPSVRMLVTSRARLHLQAETLLTLEGLHVGQGNGGSGGAVDLFMATASRLDRSFDTRSNEAVVAEICKLLDGIPLAIELAASWIRVMCCDDILAELRQGLDLLAAAAPDLPERHQSIRATFQSSWRLLDDEEQHVLTRLAVFRAPFDRHAAHSVAGATPQLLLQLLDKSLLVGSAGRFSMTDVIRQYAREILSTDQQAEASAAARHARFFADQIDALKAGLARSEPASLSEAARFIDELLAAWAHAIAHRDADLLGRLAPPLFDYFNARGLAREGAAAYATALSALSGAQDIAVAEKRRLLGVVQVRLGAFHNILDMPHDAERLLRAGLSAAREYGDAAETAFALQRLGANRLLAGDYDGAAAAHEEAKNLAISEGDELRLGRALAQLGNIAWSCGDLTRAANLCGEGLAIAREQADRQGMWIALNTLGVIAASSNDYAGARTRFSEGLAIQRELGNQRSAATLLHNLGSLAIMAGQPHEARGYLTQALQISERMGYRAWMSTALSGLAEIEIADGDHAEAQALLRRSVATAQAAGNAPVLLKALGTVARLHAATGDMDSARRTGRLVAHHPASDQESRSTASDLLMSLQDHSAALVDPDRELDDITHGLLHPTRPDATLTREVSVSARTGAARGLLLLLLMLPLQLSCASRSDGVPISRMPYLSCANTPPGTAVDRMVGRMGAALRSGAHEVIIPARALASPRNIQVRQRPGPQVGIDLTSDPRNFSREATVVISYDHCTPAELASHNPANFRIFRQQQSGDWVPIPSEVDLAGRRVLGETKQNSGFIIVTD
jgi:predicted ATPase